MCTGYDGVSLSMDYARNAFRYRCGDVPTTRPKRSRSDVTEPNPASVAICSIDNAVVSSSSWARLTRAVCSHCNGDVPACS